MRSSPTSLSQLASFPQSSALYTLNESSRHIFKKSSGSLSPATSVSRVKNMPSCSIRYPRGWSNPMVKVLVVSVPQDFVLPLPCVASNPNRHPPNNILYLFVQRSSPIKSWPFSRSSSPNHCTAISKTNFSTSPLQPSPCGTMLKPTSEKSSSPRISTQPPSKAGTKTPSNLTTA